MKKYIRIQLWGREFYIPVWVSKPQNKKELTEEKRHREALNSNNLSVIFLALGLLLTVITFLMMGWSIP